MTEDRRLIEDYIPIQAISAEASREKSVRKGHISTLHLWWARRPLVACRAAVYGALVPASQFVPENAPENKQKSLGRANAAQFVEKLCKYPGTSQTIAEAQKHILTAHAQRLSQETGKTVTMEDILEGRAPRPKVLDMFAGGGAIPLEALRLGCEAYALDLNPVAHIIELCTLVYPQKYGKPDPVIRGMTGVKNSQGETTWGGLAEEVRYWGNWVLEKVKAEIGDLYPMIPESTPQSESKPKRKTKKQPKETQATFEGMGVEEEQCSFLTPVAYLWTRTVRCKNAACGAIVPLVKQTWLCKKKDRNVALRIVAPAGEKRVRFEVVEAKTEKGLGFDPAAGSKGGNATCPFCGTVSDSTYVKAEGCEQRIGQQMMAVVCTRKGRQGKVYLAADEVAGCVPDDKAIRKRIAELCQRTGLTVPEETIEINPRSMDVDRWGLTRWCELFTPRQMLCLLTFAAKAREATQEMMRLGYEEVIAKGVSSYLAVLVDRQADYNSTSCRWLSTRELIGSTFSRQALPMVWDFTELNPFGEGSGSPEGALDWLSSYIKSEASFGLAAEVFRGSATLLPWSDNSFDAVITDPPYYDNVSYSNLSDFFYIWLKRSIGDVYPEHFATEATPKKKEVIAAFYRHDGNKAKSRQAYETMMAQSLAEASRVLKVGGQMVVVYAHKTTLGWATLVEALRHAGFTVTEAWPLDTERKGRLEAIDTSALASSIFLVARKRTESQSSSYEEEVQPALEQIVRERVETLLDMGITGADLVIAAVGAGLRAFTRFAKVEYANGEEMAAEKFLAEVEGIVLEVILEKIFGVSRSSISSVDAPTRFYVLWRFTYKAAELDAGEAIVFTYGQHVELDGQKSLSAGSRALVEKKKGKYRLRDFTERGDWEKLGTPDDNGSPAPLVDTLHRILWLIENEPRNLTDFLLEVLPDRERLRLVAQALAGAGLSGKSKEEEFTLTTTADEQSALRKLLANWRSLVEQPLASNDQRGLITKGDKK